MFSLNRTGTLIKMISTAMAGIFLFQQLAWAGDLADPVHSDPAQDTYMEPFPGASPEESQNFQSFMAALIATRNAVEDFISTQYSGDTSGVEIHSGRTYAEYAYCDESTGRMVTVGVESNAEGVPVYITKINERGDVIYTRDVEKGLENIFEYTYANEGTEHEYVRAVKETAVQNVPGMAPVTYSVTKEYDAGGRLLCIMDGSDNMTAYSYYQTSGPDGAEGDLKEVIDALGNRTGYLYEYDADGGYLKRKTVKSYENRSGELILKQVLEEEYDSEGRGISGTDKYGVTRTRDHTTTDGVITCVVETVSYTDENGNHIMYSTTRTYSPDGKYLLKEVLPDGTTRRYTYDENSGNLMRVHSGDTTITYTYDPLTGALKSAVEVNAGGTVSTADDISRLTMYFGAPGKERIKEVRVFSAGSGLSGKPVIREMYHYDSDNILQRVVKKSLKSRYQGTTGAMTGPEYKVLLDTVYGVYNGQIKKKRETTAEAYEDFVYSGEGDLIESVITDGIYHAKTRKEYNRAGDVVKIIRGNGSLEKTVTDISYIKNSLGQIVDKREITRYRKYDENGTVVEETRLSSIEYEYYGKYPEDRDLALRATREHKLRSMTFGGKIYSYKYHHDANGYLDMTAETVSWNEGEASYTSRSFRKFDQNGDITASIDAEGVYSEYTYSSEEENAMGGRVQTRKTFYRPADTGYELYRVSSFQDVDIRGLSVSPTVRTYDFENDLVSVRRKNGSGDEDDPVISYVYEKDRYGNILKKYESGSGREGVKVYGYDLKGDMVRETARNGVSLIHTYTRDASDGHITSIETANGLYPDHLTVTDMDVSGNVTSLSDANGITMAYSYEKSGTGLVTRKTVRVSKKEGEKSVLDHSETYTFTPDGEIAETIDKNNVKKIYTREHDAYGNVKRTTITTSWESGAGSKVIIKEYNIDGTESATIYINDPADKSDDVIKTFSYEYDSSNGTLIRSTETGPGYSSGIVYEYDITGDLKSRLSRNGIKTTYVYERDLKGNLLKRYQKNNLYPSSLETEEYDIHGNKVSYTDANGRVFNYENTYDLRGNLSQVVEFHERRDENGILLWNYRETSECDPYGRITSITDRNGITLTYTYETNARGEITASRETDSRYAGCVTRNFDPSTSDVISMTDRLGHTTGITYERSKAHGNILKKTETTSLGETTVYHFDDHGRIYSITDKFGREVLVAPEFDDFGNMLKRTLRWAETFDGRKRGFKEEEYYSVDGDLTKRIDYTGKEFRYQYQRNASGGLEYMTSIESSRGDYELLDVNPGVSVTPNGSGGHLYLLCDGQSGYHANVDWTDPEDPASFVIDLGEDPPEYNTVKIQLRNDGGRAYKYKLYTSSDRNDTSKWDLVDDKSDAFYADLQQAEFETVNDRYIMIQGNGICSGGLYLEVREVEIYKKEQVKTVNLTTTGYNAEGRIVSKTGTTGRTIYYSYETGERGEVVKVHEGLTPGVTIGVLEPVDIKDTTTIDCTWAPDTSVLYDDDLNTRTNINWRSGNTPASLVINLTDDNANAGDISAVGIALRSGEDRWFGYRIYYATAEEPDSWILAVDGSDYELSRSGDWRVEKFSAPVSAKYIRVQGCTNSYGDTELDMEEIKVYRTAQKTDAVKVKEVDEYGRTVTEKNALMLAWEEREDLQSIFPEADKKAQTGWWRGKTLADWAVLFGAWEDPRIKEQLSDYDNKTCPEIEKAFKRGDVSEKLYSVIACNATGSCNLTSIIDGNTDTRGYIEWAEAGSPGYYLIELLEETRIDRIRLKLHDEENRKYKYRIYASLDGRTWTDVLVNNDKDYASGWQEHGFAPVSARYIKIEGCGSSAISLDEDTCYLSLSEIMIMDNSPKEEMPPEQELSRKISGIRAVGASYVSGISSILDGNTGTRSYLEWANNDIPAYYLVELSEDVLMDKISVGLYDDGRRRYKYKVYGSTDGMTWGEPLVDRSSVFAQGARDYLFDPVKVRYLKIEGAGGYWIPTGSEMKQLALAELNIFINGILGPPPRDYDKEQMKDWAKNIGFRMDSDLIKFARTANVTDKPELRRYSYSLDEKGTVRRISEYSSHEGETLKFFDEKGRLVEEIAGKLTDTNIEEMERIAPALMIEVRDSNGNLKKTVYREHSPDKDFLTGHTEVGIASVGSVDSRYDPGQAALNRVIDGNHETYINVTWRAPNTPAAFLLTLEDEEAIDRIRFRLRESNGRSYRYKVYVRSGIDEEWTLVADRSRGTPWNWQDISFDKRAVKYIKVQGADEFTPQIELEIYEMIVYRPSEKENVTYLREYNEDGDLAVEKDILAIIWEENSGLREYFVSPGAQGTGVYSGWTLKEWAARVGSWTDPRLASYKRCVSEYTPELDAVLSADPAVKVRYTNQDGTINEYSAVSWARSADKNLYPSLAMYGTDIAALDNAYLAAYSYEKAADGSLKSATKTVNLSRRTLTTYDTDGSVESRDTKRLDLTRRGYTYEYHANGNVEKMTTISSGHESGESYTLYSHNGDVSFYHDRTGDYRYIYTYDKWNNIEKVNVGSEETMFLTGEETLDRDAAEVRIIEYFRAILYRDPTHEELEAYIAVWQETGFTHFARGIMWQSDEYLSGDKETYGEKAGSLRDQRVSAVMDIFSRAQAVAQDIIDRHEVVVAEIAESFTGLRSAYAARKDANDKKYMIEIYREELGREATQAELDDALSCMRLNDLTLSEMRERLRDEDNPDSEYNRRRRQILSIINALYDTSTGTGLLKDYLDAADKYGYVTGTLGLKVKAEYLTDLTMDEVLAMIAWLKTQDNHFGRSAVEALYKHLADAGIQDISGMDGLLKELIFLEMITGVITENTQGMLLISMHAVKKVAGKYSLNLYGTAYDLEEFLRKFDEIQGYSAIVHYNGTHFMNVTGVIKQGDRITHVRVTNGFINGEEQTKTISIDEFAGNYGGKLLSTERSDYANRLTDAQLRNIRGAGWWQKLWKSITKIFKKIVKAVKKIISYILEPVKQFIKAVKFALEKGKWGRVFGAIGAVVVGSVLSIFQPQYAFVLINTAMSMATAVCYGDYQGALISLGIGLAVSAITPVIRGIADFAAKAIGTVIEGVKTAIDGVVAGIKNIGGKMLEGIINFGKRVYEGALSVYDQALTAVRTFGNGIFGSSPFGEVMRAYSGGLVMNGISRYINEEIDKTSNWLAKLGIGAAGTLMLMPALAFGNPNFATPDSTGMFLELTLGSLNNIVSQEVYKTLEDELGEEWYATLLRSSINSIVSAGFESLKQAVHLELGTKNVDVLQKIDGTEEIFDTGTGELLGKHRKTASEEITEIGEYRLDESAGEYILTDGTVTQRNGSLTKTYIVKNEEVIRVSTYDEFEQRYLMGIEGVDGGAIDKGNYDEYLFGEDGLSIWRTEVRNGGVTDRKQKTKQPDSPETRYKKDFKESYGQKILEDGWSKEYRTPPDDNDDPPISMEGLMYLIWKEYNDPLGTVYLPRV